MGYSTNFEGSLLINRPLTEKEKNYINLITNTRRMRRDVVKLMELYNGEHGNPFATDTTPEAIYGREGEYFAMDDGQLGQNHDASIIDYNTPPGQLGYGDSKVPFEDRWKEMQRRVEAGECQPGLWCNWEIEEPIVGGEQVLVWDGGEKFYEYVAWLKYYINHFFSKWGVMLNGEITWTGEESTDLGKIIVTDNVVDVKTGTITYE
jgi:hypothetical protein